MFKYFLFSFLFYLTIFSNMQAIYLFPEMFVKKRFFSSTTTFDIEANKKTIGTVCRKQFSWMTHYLLEDENGQCITQAKIKPTRTGIHFDIEDATCNLIGTIQGKTPACSNTFEIFSSTGQKVGTTKWDLLKNKWLIKDPEKNSVLASLGCSNSGRTNNWRVKVEDLSTFTEESFHPHMFLVLIAFQVHAYCESREDSLSLSNSLL